MQVYAADRVFTGTGWLNDHAVLVDDGWIKDIVPLDELPGDQHSIFHSPILAPGFIDLQIYGAAGKLFSAYPEPDSLHKLYEQCLSGGTHLFLPTVATNTTTVFYQCIDAVRKYLDANGKGVAGLHLEGPWINPEKRGAHTREHIHPPEMNEVKTLIEYGKGIIKMITLAPEVCSQEVLEFLSSENIILSAGHSNATYQQGIDAFNAGIPAATHLFNAMSAFHHREPGLPAAVMQHNRVMSSIIPDGYHVDFDVISIAKKVIKDRLFIITDAVTETTIGPYRHTFTDGRYLSGGVLSGSALTMAQGVKNLVRFAGVEPDEALRMASLFPASLLGRSMEYGKIETGFRAAFATLDVNLDIVDPSA